MFNVILRTCQGLLCLFVGLVCLVGSPAQAASAWPASSSGTTISSGLSANIEPSGLLWQPRLEQFIVVGDEGEVCKMDSDGANVTCYSPGSDLEGVTLVDEDSD